MQEAASHWIDWVNSHFVCVNTIYSQLFGELDPDQDVSPDTEDPELTGELTLCLSVENG